MKTAILILAAGRSRRMGKPKQLLKVGAKTLLQRAIETALGASAGAVYCVIGAQATAIREHIRGYPIHILENTEYNTGLSSSLKCGIEAVEKGHLRSVLVLLADQPKITAQHLKALLRAHEEAAPAIVATGYPHGLGVPAVFSRVHFARLKGLQGDKGAREILNSNRDKAIGVPFTDLVDIDTPQDYQNFLASDQ